MSFEDLISLAAYGAIGIWMLMILARLQNAWQTAVNQTRDLTVALRNAEQRLKREHEQVKKAEEETKKTQDQMSGEKKEQEQRREALTSAVPPPPDEIRVLAEFPTSPRDQPWVAEFRRVEGARQRSGDPDRHWALFWSANHTAAVQRASQLIDQKATYGVGGVRRFE